MSQLDQTDPPTDASGARGPGEAPIIVGIGASAASPQTIERFFARYVSDDRVSVVLVLQHREALDEAELRAAIDRLDGFTAEPAEDGQGLLGGHVYICRPDKITTVSEGRFSVRSAAQRPGNRGTIDSFLVSLAQDRGEEAIGVILQGTGGDGTLAVAALKDNGGLAVAERPADASHEELAHGETAASLADFVLPVEEITEHVRIYVQHLKRLAERKGLEEAVTAASESLSRIAEVLRSSTGNDFHGYKQNTFLRRVQRRMLVLQIEDIDDYVEFLRRDKDEPTLLFNDLLIGVTQFFRDAKEFEVLEREVIPKLFEKKDSGSNVRIWVLGCATGEEAYSIGILLREYMAKLVEPPHVQIFATDLDGRALASARVGRYRTNIEADISPERLARWFVKEGDTYFVVKELREMCIFSQHNVIKDAPFSKLDLISCRNLLIYLNAELQNRVIPLFHFALLPDRYLFLGNSENVTRHPKLFAPLDRRARIFKKLETGTRLPPEFPIAPMSRRVGSDVLPAIPGAGAGLERRAQRVAEKYAPAYVITDDHMQVLHFSGRMGRFLEPAAGVATLDLLNLVHRDLRLELRAALTRTLEANEAAQAKRVQLETSGGDRSLVDITVEPLQELGGPRNLVVLFTESESDRDAPQEAADSAGMVSSEHMERLEAELKSTRDRLQATIEELESTNEELKSSNEEYQSLNEELQSANEELETSREELQSVNEELTTVNGELAHRVHELTRATSDLKNFRESTPIPTIFLDNDLKVMNFTPAVTQVLHLVETDIGRPISHIKARVPIEELFDDARRVLRTLSSTEHELTAPDTGTRYIVRILPYRSIDNFIAGVVMTFVDVTAITRAEERQRLLLAELQHRVRNTLGVVRSVARRTAGTSETVDDYARHLDGRLDALARVQAVVTRDPQSGVDLQLLLSEELKAHGTAGGAQLERLHGPRILLQPKAAELFGLAIHELTTNAAKYGAFSRPQGRVRVEWDLDHSDPQRDMLHFKWIESGVDKPSGASGRRGFGTELLERTLSYELGGKPRTEFTPTGLHWSIRIPMDQLVVGN
ncbi:MAG: CheR family methyltransferase [Devosia sp.]